ncbi:alpha/beta hydrolase [Nocardia sp. NPDC005366]|uniref:alpha/beta hydrolase n=1 Tax=Nocardia sp. NPDC005366 TaxID=3156878 RepID=UPI0033A27527
MSAVHQIEFGVGGLTLSAVAGEPSGECRGALLALHGGGARAAYWDSPVSSADSLVRLASELGWRVLAPDRPGYGASYGIGLDTGAQAELVEQVVATWLESEAAAIPETPVVVVGHSLGAIVALRVAARARIGGLAGVAVGGVPLLYTKQQTLGLRSAITDGVHLRHERPLEARKVSPGDWYGPAGSFDERILEFRGDLVSSTPSAEFVDARDAPDLLPRLMRDISVPVQWAVAEHELTTAPSGELLTAAQSHLRRAASVDYVTVRGSGHNLSLGGRARSYHLRVLAFAEAARASFLGAGSSFSNNVKAVS